MMKLVSREAGAAESDGRTGSMDAFRVFGLASYAPPDEQGRTTVTRELKLALIVGFSLVLFVTVLVSDHLSRARRAELPRIAEPTSSLTAIPPSAEIKPTSDRAPAPKEAPAVRPLPMPGDAGSPFGPGNTPAIANAGPAGGSPAPVDNKVAFGPMVTPVARGVLPSDAAQIDDPLVVNQTPGQNAGQAGARQAGGRASVVPGPVEPTVVPSDSLMLVTPVAPVTPVTPKIDEYTIQEGDTLYELARQFYKDPKHWKALQAYNRDRLTKDGQPRAGGRIFVPPLDTLLGRPSTQIASADLPALVTPKKEQASKEPAKKDQPKQAVKPAAKPATYKVQKNDTLTSIAQRMLGSQKRVNDLIKANPGVDPENMKVGTELRIPA